jgi:hypothetical protein
MNYLLYPAKICQLTGMFPELIQGSDEQKTTYFCVTYIIREFLQSIAFY